MSDTNENNFYIWITGAFGIITVLVGKLVEKKGKKETTAELKSKEVDIEMKEIAKADNIILRLDKQVATLLKANDDLVELQKKHLEIIEALKHEKELILEEQKKQELTIQIISNENQFLKVKNNMYE